MKKIKYYIFCIRWLWKNRNWQDTRQKFKALERDYANSLNPAKDKLCAACTHFYYHTYCVGHCKLKGYSMFDTTTLKHSMDTCDCGRFKKRR